MKSIKIFSVLACLSLTACGPIQAQYYESMAPQERVTNLQAKTDQELCNAFTNDLVGPETKATVEKLLIERGKEKCYGKYKAFAYVGDGEKKAKIAAAKKLASLPDVTAAEKSAIIPAVKDILKDPESAKFKWPPFYADNGVYCGFVNARNSYGGYGGFDLFYVSYYRSKGRMIVKEASMSVHDVATCPIP